MDMRNKFVYTLVCFCLLFLLTGVSSYHSGTSNSVASGRTSVSIEVGDILFVDIRPLWVQLFNLPSNSGDSNDHCAIYAGNNKFWETADYTAWEGGFFDGVQKSSLAWMKWVYCEPQIGKVKYASSSQKSAAVNFAKSQRWEKYQHSYSSHGGCYWANPDVNAPPAIPQSHPFYNKYNYYDKYIDEWYCSELVWAGYLHQLIELDRTDDPDSEGHYYVAVDDLRLNNAKINLYDWDW
jgi:hypothetical protein